MLEKLTDLFFSAIPPEFLTLVWHVGLMSAAGWFFTAALTNAVKRRDWSIDNVAGVIHQFAGILASTSGYYDALPARNIVQRVMWGILLGGFAWGMSRIFQDKWGGRWLGNKIAGNPPVEVEKSIVETTRTKEADGDVVVTVERTSEHSEN